MWLTPLFKKEPASRTVESQQCPAVAPSRSTPASKCSTFSQVVLSQWPSMIETPGHGHCYAAWDSLKDSLCAKTPWEAPRDIPRAIPQEALPTQVSFLLLFKQVADLHHWLKPFPARHYTLSAFYLAQVIPLANLLALLTQPCVCLLPGEPRLTWGKAKMPLRKLYCASPTFKSQVQSHEEGKRWSMGVSRNDQSFQVIIISPTPSPLK